MLDGEDGMAEQDQAPQRFQQPLDVGGVEPVVGSSNRKSVAVPGGCRASRKDASFEPLRLAARERGRRLAERHVAQARFLERLQALDDLALLRRRTPRRRDRSCRRTSPMFLPR